MAELIIESAEFANKPFDMSNRSVNQDPSNWYWPDDAYEQERYAFLRYMAGEDDSFECMAAYNRISQYNVGEFWGKTGMTTPEAFESERSMYTQIDDWDTRA